MQDAIKGLAKSKALDGKAKSRWPLLLIILIPALSLGLAWFMYFFGQLLPEGRTNKGELMLPPASFTGLALVEGVSPFELEKLEGRWGILVVGTPGCDSDCQAMLYQTRQAHIALGREADRVVRLYVSTETVNSAALQDEHPGVAWLQGETTTVQETLNLSAWPSNRYFIVDPLGNIMMGYQAGQPGTDLLKDLKRLLKASKLG